MNPQTGSTRIPWIIAHRGARLDAPENTRAAFDAALASPVDGIETDVQMTRDGVAVLYHDGNLHKINGARRRISDCRYEELQGIDWGSWFADAFADERLLTLTETLRRYGRRTRFLLEIKSFLRDRRRGRSLEIARVVMDTIAREIAPPFDKNVFILSFDLEVLDRAYGIRPDLKYVWNIPAEVTVDGSIPPPDYLHALCLPVSRLSAAAVSDVHQRGLRVMTYSCNTPRHVNKALTAGADTMMTDRPAWLTEYLGR